MTNSRSVDPQSTDEPFQLFNLQTMSGVFPGSRTARFQRIRLAPQEPADAPASWARLLWYDEPRACVVMMPPGSGKAVETPLVRLGDPSMRDVQQRLRQGLDAAGYVARICGACKHWRPLGQTNGEGLPVGRCTFNASEDEVPEQLAPLTVQSTLALDCAHFEQTANPAGADWPATAEITIFELDLRRAAEVRKEEEAHRESWRGRLGRLFGLDKTPERAPSWTEQLLERTGVGAGAESCFGCHGRIANLGALVVASPEDDKQTYSVWRCRQCFATYFNRWIDRWERLDSLETDETYWRIAPAEAIALLDVMAGVAGGEHPEGRRERAAERDRFEAFVADRPPVSHQIKLGR